MSANRQGHQQERWRPPPIDRQTDSDLGGATRAGCWAKWGAPLGRPRPASAIQPERPLAKWPLNGHLAHAGRPPTGANMIIVIAGAGRCQYSPISLARILLFNWAGRAGAQFGPRQAGASQTGQVRATPGATLTSAPGANLGRPEVDAAHRWGRSGADSFRRARPAGARAYLFAPVGVIARRPVAGGAPILLAAPLSSRARPG